MKELGRNGDSREVEVPIRRDEDSRGCENELYRSAAEKCRKNEFSRTGQEPDTVPVKELRRSMAKPTEEVRERLKKLVRFLEGCPRHRNYYCYQEAVGKVVVWTKQMLQEAKRVGSAHHEA